MMFLNIISKSGKILIKQFDLKKNLMDILSQIPFIQEKKETKFLRKTFLLGELFFHILVHFFIFGAHFCQFSTFCIWNFGPNGFQIKESSFKGFSSFHLSPIHWLPTLFMNYNTSIVIEALVVFWSHPHWHELEWRYWSIDTLTFNLNISCGYGKLSYKHSSKQKITQVDLWFKKSHWKRRDSSGVLTPLSLKTCGLSNVYIICWS